MGEKLAVYGGPSIRKDFLPYGGQWIDENDIQAVVDVLKSDYLTTGPAVGRFEQAFAKYVGAKYAIAFSNGTAALHAACFAAGIAKNDEVITSPLTFVASANCILYTGGKPVFADIDPATYNIDPRSIEAKITKNTKAIIPVHFAGQPVDLDEIHKLAKKYNLIVIEDAAHALGAHYKNRKIGALSEMTMFSLHPVKHITTGEGGMITTNNKDYYQKLLQFRTHGITKDANECFKYDGPWYYEMQYLGYNYRMTDMQAALGLSQLQKVDIFIERRKKYVAFYNEAFKKMEEIICPKQMSGADSSWHLYVIRLNLERLTADRKAIYEALQKENIGVNVHYIPVHTQPFYHKLGYQSGICLTAEDIYNEIITLPLFPKMEEKDVRDVIAAVNKVIHFYSRKDVE
ncbi:UDP-4-amino-4,6-dideoxy-N-acetyl-beta-L-altrosamine transaminase [Bacillus niameyensis]|uniref:UDP-4-amino-4, 6-dideoxy-N-acetyl-beta-L-altrosamine transaminase n=1 Tax=Bacillus niameyensis TaxID=1522308 RepID=UPI000784B99F|nr:UDP-4-amino-4,6-dideoxy-N-acetyl-beta-L-altrosamine transaminase [Bacillus niameyensis]